LVVFVVVAVAVARLLQPQNGAEKTAQGGWERDPGVIFNFNKMCMKLELSDVITFNTLALVLNGAL
jgi:hypothetical protein